MTPGIVAESDLAGNLKSEYVFFDGERVARRDFDASSGAATGVFYYFSDHLKTASMITDSAGNIKAESDYYPWGGELQFVNNDPNHYKFTGKERDTESGLDYFGARYYSNGLGRFITPDWAAKATAVPYAEFSDPQSLNLYSYVRNIPTTRIDADGHCGTLCLVLTAMGDTAAGGLAELSAPVTAVVGGSALVLYVSAQSTPTEDQMARGEGQVTLPAPTTQTLPATGVNTQNPSSTPTAGVNTQTPPSTETTGVNTENPPTASNAGSVSTSSAAKNTGTIYVVPGRATPSGKPYVGRHNKPNPAKTRRSNDGRDRTQAKVVDEYPANDTQAGRTAEQQEIERRGVVDNLDNKRNEIAPK
jgi:RHS repeat-associated protein